MLILEAFPLTPLKIDYTEVNSEYEVSQQALRAINELKSTYELKDVRLWEDIKSRFIDVGLAILLSCC